MSNERSPREVCSRTIGTSEDWARPICISVSLMYLATVWLRIVAQPLGCTSPEGGRMKLNREITLPATPAEVWDPLTEPAWLGEDASIDLRPAGEVRVGERAGFVEQAEEPRR